MTADVNVNVSKEEEELDMSGHEDLPAADCNGVKDGNANAEDDPDASYVFVGATDAVSDGMRNPDAPDLATESELPSSLHKDSEYEVSQSVVGDHDQKSSLVEPDAGGKGENGAVNGNVAIDAHEMDGQRRVEEDSAGRFQVNVSEAIEPEPELLQANGADAKTLEKDEMDSLVTQESQFKSSVDVTELPLNQSANVGATGSINVAESESNQSNNHGAIGDVNVAELESNQSGNFLATDSAIVAVSEQNESGVEDNVEGESKFNLVTDAKEDQHLPILVTEGIQNDNDLDLDHGNVVSTDSLHVKSCQMASELEQNVEAATSLVVNDLKFEGDDTIDSSSSAEYTNGLPAQGCAADNDAVNGFDDASENSYEQSGSSENIENSVSSDAKSGMNETSSVSDAKFGNGFPASIDNDAIRDPTNEISNSVIELDSETVNGHIVYEARENLPPDQTEESDLLTVDDFTHSSLTAPEQNRLSEVVKTDLYDNGSATESYKTIPVAPANDIELEPVVEIGDSCPVNNAKIHDCEIMEVAVANLDVNSSESLPHTFRDTEVVIEPECDPVANDTISSSPDTDAKPEIVNNSLEVASEEKLSAFSSDGVDLESEVSGGAAKCVCSEAASAEHQDREACLGDTVGSPVNVKAASEVEKVVSTSDSHESESEVPDGFVLTSQSTLNFIQDDSDKKKEVTEVVNKEEASTSSAEGFAVDASDEQNSVVEVVKKPFYFMIRIPRYDDDENLKEQIKHAQNLVDEKTKSRDAIRVEMQKERANCTKYDTSANVAVSEETAARDLFKAKRKEIESVLVVINRGKSAADLKNIDNTIHGMEHMIQHETLPLKEEKSYIHEIKRLKQVREKLSSNLGSQEDVQKAIDKQAEFEERLKILRKEADLLRENVIKAEIATKNAEEKCDHEYAKLDDLTAQFRAADKTRQEAYAHLQSLRKRLYEKNNYFYEYKNDATAALDILSKGDKEELQSHCLNQVERVMELWNNNDEFRKEYIRCNMRSTVRRLRTLDGRSLGPDEDPPVIPNFVNERLTKKNDVPSISTFQEEKIMEPVQMETIDDRSMAKVGDQKHRTIKSKKPAKHVPSGNGLATVSSRIEIEEVGLEEPKLTKEEEELAKKAEEMRKEEAAVISREKRLQEEKEKNKQAMERKRRLSDKAQARAELRAKKEAEQKDKEKERRQRKKEKRKVLEEVNGSNEGESAPSSETATETKESETAEKPVAVTKRSQKPLHFTKQTKSKPVPLPLRNRSKRKMQTWMWVPLVILAISALFLMGNGSFSLQRFGF